MMAGLCISEDPLLAARGIFSALPAIRITLHGGRCSSACEWDFGHIDGLQHPAPVGPRHEARPGPGNVQSSVFVGQGFSARILRKSLSRRETAGPGTG